jgi:hypothetical protein
MRTIKGQGLGEYSICLAIVLAATLGMQVYIKRGLAGRYKELVDHVAAQASAPKQYEPYYIEDEFTVLQTQEINESFQPGGKISRDILEDKATIKGTSIRKVVE